MKTGRGCFSIAHNDGFVYVFGGVCGAEDKRHTDLNEELNSGERSKSFVEMLTASCEKYDVEND